MKIGLNCYNINPKYKGGINTYTFGLLDGFVNINSRHDFIIYAKESNKHLFEKYSSLENFKVTVLDDPGRLKMAMRAAALMTCSKSIYKIACDILYNFVTSRINSDNIDVLYTPTTILFPYKFKMPTVISMHDIQHVHFPEYFSKLEIINREIHFGLSGKLASFFQASSSFIKEDLIINIKAKPEQIFVIPEGVLISEFSTVNPQIDVIKKYKLSEKFLFFPAQLWHHKNHITVLKALKLLKEEKNLSIPLVLTGAKESAAETIFSFIEENKLADILYLGLVPFDDLKALYQTAAFLITAVLYESSSLPILEAAAAGTPVIASKTPPNVEMGNTLRLNLFEPKDHHQLADMLYTLWGNEAERKSQIEFNNRQIENYSWDKTAAKYITEFEKIIKKQ